MIIQDGTWWLRSEKDPRWNCNGSDDVGGLVMPEECKLKLETLKKELGEPPDDLEWGYMKN